MARDRDERCEDEARGDREGQVVAAQQGVRARRAARALGRDGRQDGEAEGASDLLGGVDEAEARPESSGATPDIASVIRAGKVRPPPMPSSSIAGRRSTM